MQQKVKNIFVQNVQSSLLFVTSKARYALTCVKKKVHTFNGKAGLRRYCAKHPMATYFTFVDVMLSRREQFIDSLGIGEYHEGETT